MINPILVIIGIILLIFSIVTCIQLIRINTISQLQLSWYFMLGLIIFFLFGYIAYYFVSTNYPTVSINSLLICLILFFGAIFVIGILFMSYQLIKALTEKTIELNQKNQELIESTRSLSEKHKELITMQDMLKQKNDELEETLENFYTIRIGMQNNGDSEKIKEENKKIKEKLETLKKETV